MRMNLEELFLVSSNRRINGCSGIQNVQALQRERRRHAKYPGIIHPYSYFRWYWDILLMLILLCDLICKPLQIAFFDASREEEDASEEDWSIILITLGATFIYFVDVLLNFNTGITDSHRDIIILRRKVITKKYLGSWFLIDVISSIPVDSIFYFIHRNLEPGGIHRVGYMLYRQLRLLNLLKIFRLFRVVQTLKRIGRAYQIPELKLRFLILILVVVTIMHWLSCFHWIVAELFNPPGHIKEGSWITQAGLWNESNWIRYINMAFISVSGMGGVGYGQITPTEPEDIISVVLSILTSVTLFGLFIGALGGIVNNMDASEKRFDKELVEVNEYMRFRNVPKPTQHRFRIYYGQKYKRHYFDEGEIFGSVSGVLRKELQMFNCQHLVGRVPFFASIPPNLLERIVGKLEFEVYLPGDTIIEEGLEGTSMYFIQEGDVQVVRGGRHLITNLESGQYFGEGALVMESHKTNASVVANDYTDTYRLSREDFEDVFKGHPEVLEMIKGEANRRHHVTMLSGLGKSSEEAATPSHQLHQRKISQEITRL